MNVKVMGNVTVNIYTTQPPPYQARDSEFVQEFVPNGWPQRQRPPMGERLIDKSNGKTRPWKGKKVGTIKLSKALHALEHHKKANRVWWCGAELEFKECPETGKKTLCRAHFCRERLCIMCSWRRSIKMFFQLSQVLDIAQQENPDTALLFLTLTVKNCRGGELYGTLDEMFEGWRRLVNHRRVKTAIKGWFRALEVTYNRKEDTYHPHFHAVLMVDKSYFYDKKAYLQTENWVHMWRTSCRLGYDPICDIRAVRKQSAERNRKHVAELTKYTVKESDILQGDEETTTKVVDVLGTSLKGRRLHAYGGILKEIAKRLKIKENPKEDDLIVLNENDTIREDVSNLIAVYKWDYGLSDYFRQGKL